ncbi:MAG: type I restriction endonuclease subunit R [Pseudarcicella sp.]|nr:type I restriction endonuclease subunit R [Pseudarcicella sp.]MBP6410847.1 type I restriction endonuclease subunit R [Pseudarcicella sp.]
MSRQSEQVLEEQLVAQLQKLGYSLVSIKDETALIANLRTQLEKHNNIVFTKTEFDKVLNILSKGSVFEKAKTLREKQHIVRDNGDNLYFEFLNIEHWCQNQYQVTHQVSQEGTYKNRYDVTLLINGLPLVQIELKRRGLEMKEAFNQIDRYRKHSFGSGAALFQYVQIFVISNGVNTKYFSNFGSAEQDFMQTFHWTDVQNKPLNNILNGFTDTFLEPCHISKMICKYIVLHQGNKALMVLRPYQYYAVEAIIESVKKGNQLGGPYKNGYIWHTTGSGKTLTSFKASQILTKMQGIKKVVFVVDRKDLDYQTSGEFNKFSAGSVDATSSTNDLIKKFNDASVPLIVTTIQKLNNAIQFGNAQKMEGLTNHKMVFVFDECHRSQFGQTHQNIIGFFKNVQLFGFTGTPILAENADGEQTTATRFGECLHKYVITDAIRDENVLKFSVEYIRTFKQKEIIRDIKVEAINEAEVFEAPQRMEAVVDYIIDNYDRKTQTKTFNTMFCVAGIDEVIKYYELFKQKEKEGKHHLKIVTVFSYAANEDPMDFEVSAEIPTELSVVEEPKALYGLTPHRREKLDEYIGHFNEYFNTAYSTKDSQSFYNYYNDVSKKTKNREIDILLVANMFLTGFDAKCVNTLFVDKNLKYHGLIQAFSRTNRINGKLKTQGNIVAFRNLKDKTDEAITLFSNKEAIAEIIMKPYENYVVEFNEAVNKLLEVVPTPDNVDDLYTEDDKMKFVIAFRNVLRLKVKMEHFTEFNLNDLAIDENTLSAFTSKYYDLKDFVKANTNKEKVSILEDVDFELELIHKDNINVSYIIQLLIKLKQSLLNATLPQEKKEQIIKEIQNLLATEVELRSKRELIERFIQENLPIIADTDEVQTEFDKYWNEEQQKAFTQLVREENLSAEKTEKLIEDYLFAEREPLRDEVLELIEGEKPSLLHRKKLGDRILKRIVDFVETFINGIDK